MPTRISTTPKVTKTRLGTAAERKRIARYAGMIWTVQRVRGNWVLIQRRLVAKWVPKGAVVASDFALREG